MALLVTNELINYQVSIRPSLPPYNVVCVLEVRLPSLERSRQSHASSDVLVVGRGQRSDGQRRELSTLFLKLVMPRK
jgi:hypothetical protein